MSAIQFWHEHIGQYISDEPASNLKARVPTRLKKGVELNSIGAGIDLFYIASEGNSHLIGKLELPSTKELKQLASEDLSGERFIAHWLAHAAPTDKPWIVGVIGKAHPNESLTISQPPSLCVFCQSGKNFEFNLAFFREDVALTQGIDWKLLAPAIYAYDDFTSLDEFRKNKGSASLTKAFKTEPKLKTILPKLRAQPNNGEHQLLSWYNRAR